MQLAAQTNVASAITVALGNGGSGTPAFAATATWGSDGFLQTRPTGNAATLLMGTFVNNTGTNATGIRLSYNFSVAAVLDEAVFGHQVFYSLTGAANSWSNLATLTSSNSATLSTNVSLPVSWNNGGTLYLLFADDNGISSPDTANQIDNFSLSVTGGTTVSGPPPCP